LQVTKAFGPQAKDARLQIRAEEHETKMQFRIDHGADLVNKVAKFTIHQQDLHGVTANKDSMMDFGKIWICGITANTDSMMDFGKIWICGITANKEIRDNR
jgi:hypothetical protein